MSLRVNCFVTSLLAITVTFLPAVFAAEAELSVSAQVDKSEVNQGERLLFQINISGPIRQAPKIRMSSWDGFNVVSTGQSQQIQMQGNKIHQTLAFVYTLVATETGDRTLGPGGVEVQGKSTQPQPIRVKVLPGLAPKQENPTPRLPQLKGEVIL